MISAFSSLDEDKKSELQEYIVEKGKSFNDKKQWVERVDAIYVDAKRRFDTRNKFRDEVVKQLKGHQEIN